MKIDASVITCPRDEDYLPSTLKSLSAAGFPSPAIIEDHDLIGAYRNWRRAIEWHVDFSPEHIDGFLVFQDDIIVASGLREWLHWPNNPSLIGAVSLYTPSGHESDSYGWRQVDLSPKPEGQRQPMWNCGGALAILMPRQSAVEFLEASVRPESKQMADYAIGQWCQESGKEYWRHTPSLVQHVGVVSAIRPNVRQELTAARMASSFCEDVSCL